MSKKRPYKPVPAPPGDAANYELVESKEGPYWRRKRMRVLNAALKKNTELTALSSPAARRIQAKLDSYLQDLETGRFIANISGRLIKAWHKNGRFDYSLLEGYEIQPDRPMYELMPGHFHVSIEKGEAILIKDLNRLRVKQLTGSVTGYYLELILLSGDPTKTNSLRIQSDISPLFSFGKTKEVNCKLSVSLPTKKSPWMILLKVSCMERDQLATGPRYSGMKVIKTGFT